MARVLLDHHLQVTIFSWCLFSELYLQGIWEQGLIPFNQKESDAVTEYMGIKQRFIWNIFLPGNFLCIFWEFLCLIRRTTCFLIKEQVRKKLVRFNIANPRNAGELDFCWIFYFLLALITHGAVWYLYLFNIKGSGSRQWFTEWLDWIIHTAAYEKCIFKFQSRVEN